MCLIKNTYIHLKTLLDRCFPYDIVLKDSKNIINLSEYDYIKQ